MGTVKTKIGFSEKANKLFEKTEKALHKVSNNIVTETKNLNSYIIIADKKGIVKKVCAKDI